MGDRIGDHRGRLSSFFKKGKKSVGIFR